MRKHKKKILRKEKGITLIALVITIIVLLILAGVSISMLTGENGILTQAQKAKNETETAAVKEEQKLDLTMAILQEQQGLVPGKKDDSKNRTLDDKTTGYSYKNPIIPKGFKAIDEGSAWYYSDENRTEVKGWNDGLVIEDSLGNQFVWVPVDGENIIYEKKDFNNDDDEIKISSVQTDTSKYPIGITSESDEKNLMTKYGGFYVARFEAGLDRESDAVYKQAETTPLNYTDVPVSKYGVKVWNCIEYATACSSANKMVNTDSVKSGLITGTQWDTIMSWYEDSGIEINKGQNWGAYSNIEYSVNGYYWDWRDENTNGDSWRTWRLGEITHLPENDNTSHWYFYASGLNSSNYKKNIADLAGNFAEWSMEHYTGPEITYHNIYRGGSWASNRSRNSLYWAYPDVSFRVVLYIL